MSKYSYVIFPHSEIIFINNFISSEHKTSKDDPLIDQIKKTIEILYKKYIISDDIGISTIHMLEIIETKIKSLFNIIENLDASFIMEAEKVFSRKKSKIFLNYYFRHVNELFERWNIKKKFEKKNESMI